MAERKPPQVVREKTSRLTGSRISTAIVFDRDFEPPELESFYRLPAEGDPRPEDFEIEGRVARYECEAEDGAKWRLALEIYLVKALRHSETGGDRTGGIRTRAGLRKLHLG